MKDFKQLALDSGVILGVALFVYGLYLIWHPLAPLVGGLILAAACGFSGYDRFRRGGR
jgi:CHASE2 domain-containing sensor protein